MLALAAILLAAPPLPEAPDAGWKGDKVCETLREDEAVRIFRCTFAPGVGHERHWHRPHWGYVLAGGTMRTTDAKGTVERTLKAGASWSSPGIDWHEVVNVGATTTAFLIVEPRR